MYGCSHVTIEELSNCGKDWASKAENVYYCVDFCLTYWENTRKYDFYLQRLSLDKI
jgi:hypothetical protein